MWHGVTRTRAALVAVLAAELSFVAHAFPGPAVLRAFSAIGLVALPIVLVSITTAIVLVLWVNRVLGLPPRLGTLVARSPRGCSRGRDHSRRVH